MCGRITQYDHWQEYVDRMRFFDPYPAFDVADLRAGYNVAPGTHPLTIWSDGAVRRVFWGYRPAWAVERKIPIAVNARVEKVLSSGYWKPLLKSGRVVVPANGWFEWLGPKGDRQPYYIQPRDAVPLYLAGLSSMPTVSSVPAYRGTDGFVVVTAAADEGLVDIHDRRPVTLSAEGAREWLLGSVDGANDLLRGAVTPAEAFEWFPVSRRVNPPGPDDPSLIEPLDC
jgi:putative SOS response-associated peptidase YedK